MTIEALVERNQQLERAVNRWRRISVVLALLLICALAVGGMSLGMLLTRGDGGEFVWPWDWAGRQEELATQRERPW